MFAQRTFARALCCLAAFGMLASPMQAASKLTKTSKQKVFDVQLKDGHLVGQVVTRAGRPLSAARITAIESNSRHVTETLSDAKGSFRLKVDQAGAYRVAVGDRAFSVRAWKAHVAPPNAKASLLCIAGDAVRGQQTTSPVVSLFTNPVVIGLGVATAISIPVIVDEQNRDDGNDGADGGAGEPAS